MNVHVLWWNDRVVGLLLVRVLVTKQAASDTAEQAMSAVIFAIGCRSHGATSGKRKGLILGILVGILLTLVHLLFELLCLLLIGK